VIQNFEIKIVRLKNSEDIIGFCYIDQETDTLYLKYPKTFYMNYDIEYEEELILVDWLPESAFYSQEITLNTDNILFTTFPNIEFGHDYLKSIRDSLNPESDMSMKINETLDEIIHDIPDGSYTIH